jgi:bifunctional non-homologous end joining protein LigD
MSPLSGAPGAAEPEPMPTLVRPMLASPGALPTGAAQADEWAFEMKWDGVRAVVYVDHGRARVLTRNDRDVTGTYPELTAMAATLGRQQLVLDGEIVAFDAGGRPDFGVLQQRMHVTSPSVVEALVANVPASFLAFDLMHLGGGSLLRLPYADRRELLERLELAGPRWATPPAFVGDGAAALTASQAQGLEGVVAKRRSSAYLPGARSRDWVKVKNIRTQEVVVGGWRPGAGNRDGTIGSLLVGIPTTNGGGRLAYAGHVGTGFTVAVLAQLLGLLTTLRADESPFEAGLPLADARDAVWVRPQVVGEVAFTEWTKDGRLRHPTWRGLRPDKQSTDVTRET